MKVGTGGKLGLSREYHKKLFGPVLSMAELSFNFWYNQQMVVPPVFVFFRNIKFMIPVHSMLIE